MLSNGAGCDGGGNVKQITARGAPALPCGAGLRCLGQLHENEIGLASGGGGEGEGGALCIPGRESAAC